MIELPFTGFAETFGTKLAIAVLTLTATATSGVAGYKIMKTVAMQGPSPVAAMEVRRDDGQIDEQQNVQAAQTVSLSVSPKVSPVPTTLPQSLQRAPVIAQPTISPQQPGASVNAGKCIVVISGSQYDVTPLRSTHPGGDIFSCGTDMTAAYTRQHGSNLAQLAKYIVTSNGQSTAPLPSGTNSSGGTGGEVDDDKREYEMESEDQTEFEIHDQEDSNEPEPTEVHVDDQE